MRSDNPHTISRSEEEFLNINRCIEKLIRIGAISGCVPEQNEFISSIFLVPKPNGDKRFILNLKCLNKFVRTVHFKLEDYRTATKLIFPRCYMTSIDLKDAYFLLSVHDAHRKFLRFKFNDQLFGFNCLPFGLSTSPFVFTKLLKPVMEFLRKKGVIAVIYLDDIFCIASSFLECQESANLIKATLENLGFLINKEKSSLPPSMRCKYLGFIFNSELMVLELPSEKRQKIFDLTKKFLNTKQCRLREFAQFLGLLISVCPAID